MSMMSSSVPDAKTSDTRADPDPYSNPDPDPDPDPNSGPDPDPGCDPDPDPDPGPGCDPGCDPDPDPDPNSGPDPDPGCGPDPDPDPDPGCGPDPDPDPDPDCDPDCDAEPDPDPRPGFNPDPDPDPDPVMYGQLFVLGCNGTLPGGDSGRRRSRFVLYRRKRANGVVPSTVHSSYTPQAAKAVSSRLRHSVSFSLSRKHSVVVEYVPDSCTDMFQIGRSSEEPIDFVVTDRTGPDQAQSSLSRFCCRILCSRDPPYSARIYAAGFDSSKNIALGERATKWRTMDGQMDALTTNGVLVMNPRPGFGPESRPGLSDCEAGAFTPGLWKEVSVCGNIFTLRETRSAQKRGSRVNGESNLLYDGSLVDLCGVTLLWRSPSGLSICPTEALLESHRQELNSSRPQCPVGFYTLSFPSRPPQIPLLKQDPDPNQPWVYVRCGHVHGYHAWGRESCPMCRMRSAYVPLWLGLERGFYVDSGKPTHTLVPCGHVCSRQTAAYWSHMRMPHMHAPADAHSSQALCPFCKNPLDVETPNVQLIFQSPLD